MMKPALNGVTVIDFSELLPGPFLTQSLCEFGAEVIKIERPPHGDNARLLGPGVFAAVNRGKRSVVADLKNEADRARVRQLIAGADVVVESYRPGVMARLGMDYASLARDNPGLVYLSITGYGQDGPWANLPGHDLNYLAAAGAIALSGVPGGEPAHAFGLPAADLCGAMYGLSALLAALYQRRETGKGQFLDVAIADCVAHWLNPRTGQFADAGTLDLEAQRKEVLTRPGYGVFQTSDHRHISICAMEDHFWKKLCGALELAGCDLPEYQRYQGRARASESINAALAARVAQFSLRDIEKLLVDNDVPAMAVIAPMDVADSEQFRGRGLIVDTDDGALVRFPVRLRGDEGALAGPPGLDADAALIG